MAFCRGVFSKIQSMFTIILSFNSRGNKQNLRRGLKNVYPSTYVKVGFLEKVHPLKQNFKICLHPHPSLSSRGKRQN